MHDDPLCAVEGWAIFHMIGVAIPVEATIAEVIPVPIVLGDLVMMPIVLDPVVSDVLISHDVHIRECLLKLNEGDAIILFYVKECIPEVEFFSKRGQ